MQNFMDFERIREILKTYEAHSRSTLLSAQTTAEVLRRTTETISVASRFEEGFLRVASAQAREVQEGLLAQQDHARAISHAVALSRVHWEHTFTKWQMHAHALVPLGFLESLKAVGLQVNRLAEISHLTKGIEDTLLRATLKNAEVFHNLQAARLGRFVVRSGLAHEIADLPVAAEFVVDYARFLPRVTSLQDSDRAKREPDIDPAWRGEEIGARLEAELLRIDKRFVELRRRGWEAMAKSGPAALLLAAHALRELFRQVLHTLAPDEQVKTSPVWLARKDATEARLTRRMRFEFLLASEPEKLATVLQFVRSLDKANQFAHTFPENRELVRVELSELEKLTYLLLVFAKEDDGD